MNHTERIIHVARQVRGLTREHARQAVELYLASVAEEAATGESVALPSIGRLRVACFKNGGKLKKQISTNAPPIYDAGFRLQTCVRLEEAFKAACRERLLYNAQMKHAIQRYTMAGERIPLPTRVKPGESDTNRVEPGSRTSSKTRKED
jgi:nucleoid DNA-binding protein